MIDKLAETNSLSPTWETPVVVPSQSKFPPAPRLDCSTSIQTRLAELEALAAELAELDAGTEEPPKAPPKRDAWPTDFRLSVIVPVYNEEATIRPILAKLVTLSMPKEIIVVDDGSSDSTPAQLRQLDGIPELRIVLKSANEGKGAALRTGFQHVTGSMVLVQDADLEYDPREIPALVQPILKGEADVVYGSRFLERRWVGSSLVHRFGNRLLTAASNLATGLKLTDMETGYKVFRAEVLRDLVVRQDRFGFEPEVTAKLARRGLKFVELPIGYRARDWDEGKKIGFRDAINALFCIIRYAIAD